MKEIKYGNNILKIFRNLKYWKQNSKNYNLIETYENPVCKDYIILYLNIKNGIINDIAFECLGCIAAIVSCELVCKYLKGKNIKYNLTKSKLQMLIGNGIPEFKLHCLELPLNAFKQIQMKYNGNI